MKSARIAGEIAVTLLGAALVVWAIRVSDAWFARHTTPLFCFESTAQIARAHAERWAGGALGVLLVVLVRPLVGRMLVGRSLRSLVGPSLRIGLALVLAVVVTDVALRALRTRRDAHPAAAPLPPAPGPEAVSTTLDVVFAGRPIRYAIDADGFRRRDVNDRPDLTAPTILVAGESFAFGFLLPYEDTIPVRLQELTGFQTVNAAVTGASTEEILARVETSLPKLSRPVAVVVFVVYNWLERSMARYRDRWTLGWNGELTRLPHEPAWLETSPIRRTLLSVYEPEDAVELARALLRRTYDTISARGAHPLFVLTEAGVPCLDGASISRRLLEGEPYDAIELELDPKMLLTGDLHPNPAGAERFATEIDRALQRAGVVPAH